MDDREKKVVIKRAGWKVECTRYDLVEIKESSEGLVLIFRNKSFFTIVDEFMPVRTKALVRESFNSVTNAKIQTISLDPQDYNRPVMSEL